MLILEPSYNFFKASEASIGDTVVGIFQGIRTNKFKQKEIVISVDEGTFFTFPANKKICGGLAIDPETHNLLPVPQLGNKTTLGCKVQVVFNGKKLKRENAKKPVESLKDNDYYNDFSVGILETTADNNNVDGVSQLTGSQDNMEYLNEYVPSPEHTTDDYDITF